MLSAKLTLRLKTRGEIALHHHQGLIEGGRLSGFHTLQAG